VAEFMFDVCGETFVPYVSKVIFLLMLLLFFLSNFFAYLPNMIRREICSDEDILFIL